MGLWREGLCSEREETFIISSIIIIASDSGNLKLRCNFLNSAHWGGVTIHYLPIVL